MSGLLERLRARLAAGQDPDARRAVVAARLASAATARNLIPERVALGHQGLVGLFTSQAEAVHTAILRAQGTAPGPVVAAWLASHGVAARARVAPSPRLRALDWSGLELVDGLPLPDEPVALTGAVCGIAETGTLMMASGPEHPVGFNFLADTHVVALPEADILASYEDGWQRLRGPGPDGTLPRTVNFITGPSRTGDIEQRLELGAHGPRRLAIVLV